jgi:hypothetical protein
MSSAETFTSITDGLWGYEYDLYMFGIVHITVRPLVASLPDGGLWLCSPGPITDALAAQIEALGPVRHLVSPNLYHHRYLGDAARRWPEATIWAPEGLARNAPTCPRTSSSAPRPRRPGAACWTSSPSRAPHTSTSGCFCIARAARSW